MLSILASTFRLQFHPLSSMNVNRGVFRVNWQSGRALALPIRRIGAIEIERRRGGEVLRLPL
jgi:hypothetical protein